MERAHSTSKRGLSTTEGRRSPRESTIVEIPEAVFFHGLRERVRPCRVFVVDERGGGDGLVPMAHRAVEGVRAQQGLDAADEVVLQAAWGVEQRLHKAKRLGRRLEGVGGHGHAEDLLGHARG